LDASPAAIGHGAAIRPAELHVFLACVILALHPCQQAASHLACTRPLDFVDSRCSFTGFTPAPSSFSTAIARILLDGSVTLDAAQPPKDSGPRAFRGLNHLEGFLPLPSEGYNISKGPHILYDRPLLLRNFSPLFSLFSCLMFSHTSSCLGTYSICVHHPSMFCAYHLSHPFSTCVFLAFFSSLSFYVHP
jgi:hypothetical protein